MREVNLNQREEEIVLPGAMSASDPGALFSVCSAISAAGKVVRLNAQHLRFIDPLGLAVLRTTMEDPQHGEGRVFHLNWMDRDLITYLVRMDFFEGLTVEGIDAQSARNPEGEPFHCVELCKIDALHDTERVASRLALAIIGESGHSADTDQYRRPVEYALKELLENAVSHARREGNQSASVWVACQHFKANDKVRLAIVDNGCGFLATLRNHAALRDKTDSAAIAAALLPRVSCNRGPVLAYEADSQNQGVGLTMTAKIAEAADGHLVVASGDAWVHTAVNSTASLGEHSWKGVAVSFECVRERLPQIDIPSLLPEVEIVVDTDSMFQ